MKTAVFFDIKEIEIDFLQKNQPINYNLVLYKNSLNLAIVKSLPKDILNTQILSVFLTSNLDSKLLSNFPNLNLIITRSTGTNHIDLNYCKKHNIRVENVCCYGGITVAEYTIGLILSLMRKIPLANNFNQVEDVDFEKYMGYDLYGKTVGIIGAGDIGANVVLRLIPFGIKILINDIKKNPVLRGAKVEYCTLEKLLKNSDIISLHCPYIPEQNHHLISAPQFAQMKQGAFLINTARGALIDISAMYKNLKNKKLGGVALDVLECETLTKNTDPQLLPLYEKNIIKYNKKIRKFENVIITPHIAFDTSEALSRILIRVIKILK